MSYPDARRNYALRLGKTIVANLQRRGWVGHVEPVVEWSRQSQCEAKPARARGDQARGGVPVQSPVLCHLGYSHDRFQRPEQKAPGQAFAFAADVHAEVHSVDGVDIGVPCGAEKHEVAGRGSAMGVRRRVGRIVVGAKIGLDFDNSPRKRLALRASRDQELAKKPGRYVFWRIFKEIA